MHGYIYVWLYLSPCVRAAGFLERTCENNIMLTTCALCQCAPCVKLGICTCSLHACARKGVGRGTPHVSCTCASLLAHGHPNGTQTCPRSCKSRVAQYHGSGGPFGHPGINMLTLIKTCVYLRRDVLVPVLDFCECTRMYIHASYLCIQKGMQRHQETRA